MSYKQKLRSAADFLHRTAFDPADLPDLAVAKGYICLDHECECTEADRWAYFDRAECEWFSIRPNQPEGGACLRGSVCWDMDDGTRIHQDVMFWEKPFDHERENERQFPDLYLPDEEREDSPFMVVGMVIVNVNEGVQDA